MTRRSSEDIPSTRGRVSVMVDIWRSPVWGDAGPNGTLLPHRTTMPQRKIRSLCASGLTPKVEIARNALLAQHYFAKWRVPRAA